MSKEITVIGPAVIDVLAGPIIPAEIKTGSQPMEEIKLSFGGDALNESVVLARMGKRVELISKAGCDEAGDRVADFLAKEGVDVDGIIREHGLRTGINIVLVDKKGERFFLTNPHGSLRKLSEEDIIPYLDFAAGFLWGLSQKMTLRECGVFANAVASCTVEHMGATEGIKTIDEPLKRYRKMMSEWRLL